MTRVGRRQIAPVLVGLVTGALVAVLFVFIGPTQRPAGPRSDPSAPAAAPMVIGPALAGSAPTSAAPVPLLELPLPLPLPPIPIPPLPPPPPPRPVPPAQSGPAGQIVALTNARRASAGCGPLRVDTRLIMAAQRHSVDMGRRGFFAHNNPDGVGFADREQAAGYPVPGGENIARGQPTAAEVMSDWMGSPPHRRNILDCAFTTVGVGYVADGHYWTQDFGN